MRSSTPSSPLNRHLFVVARHLCSQTWGRPLTHFSAPSPARSSMPLLGPSSESERIQSRTLLWHWVHSTATWPLSSAHRRLPLRCHLAGTRANPVVTLLCILVLLEPGCAGSSAAWPLVGAHRHLCIHASSALLFQGRCCAYPFGKKKGAIFGMQGVAVNADAG
jgi:hypothetical protein